jgi:sugar phosphate permease
MKPVYRKIVLRLVPFLMLLYVVSFLDRVNVGFAALTMNSDLGISESVFGLAAGMFFLGYFLFEVPSNLALLRVGARRWIAAIMVCWGVVSMGRPLPPRPAHWHRRLRRGDGCPPWRVPPEAGQSCGPHRRPLF